MESKWLVWSKALRSISRAGLTYGESPFDIERYKKIQAIAAEMMATATEARVEDVRAVFKCERGYETPKIDVRGVVFREARILLVRELQDNGRWTLPGGWADAGDRPSEAVEREVWEETGYQVRATKLLAALDRRLHGHRPPHPFGVYKLFFLCELIGGAPRRSLETDEARFFSEDSIPPLSLSRVTPDEIMRLFAHYHHPDWQADFD